MVLPTEPVWARSNWQSFCVGLPDECDQREVMQLMLDGGVSTRRGVMCAHRERHYSECGRRVQLLESENAQDHTILLPMHGGLTDGDQERVARALGEAILTSSNLRPVYAVVRSS